MAHEAIEAAVSTIIDRIGTRLVVGTPLGIGKPNALLNALYRRAKRDSTLQLEFATALSLNPPRGKRELEERFLAPARERIWGDWERLEYVDDQEAGQMPRNVHVVEFYVRSGSVVGHPTAQRDIMSANYSMAARDIVSRGLNVVLQSLAVKNGVYSYGSNPDLTPELFTRLRATGRPFLAVGQVNRKLPWFGHRAIVPEGAFEIVVDDPALDHEPFSVPHEPVSLADYAIGLRASALVKDGGTLQVGIGALGDAACHALRLRHQRADVHRSILERLGGGHVAHAIGGVGAFEEGLYVASELLSNPLFALYEAGLVKRRVYDADTGDAGTSMQGAFFVGPRDFYERLRALPDQERALIDMTSVAEVNRIFQAYDLEKDQRRKARFLNVCMKATLLGAAVSDQVENGQVVSGVGGQHDFVTMAHQLPDGRSILMFRATRGAGRTLQSNVVWEYPHVTIARHLRDVFVTEYGVADLRAKTDEECIKAMLAIADSRVQNQLLDQARRARKIDPTWEIPAHQRDNLPERLGQVLSEWTKPRGNHPAALPPLPFGCDFTADELELAGRLKKLDAAQSDPARALALAKALAMPASGPKVDGALRHLRLAHASGAKERLLARLVRAAYAL